MADTKIPPHVVSDVLDSIGMSRAEIQWRIKTHIQCDSILRALDKIKDISFHQTGSRAEGIGLHTLGSDTDAMICMRSFRVILDFSEWKLLPGMVTLLLDTTDVHPGYCRLIAMRTTEPTFLKPENRLISNLSLVPCNGMLLLGNNIIKNSPGQLGTIRQGPAQTFNIANTEDTDIVFCIHVKWPTCAREWLDRNRFSGCPHSLFIKDAERRGIHVVPVGHKSSPYKDTEWRVSFALLELALVRMWPTTLMKCYILLKVLRKNIVEQAPHLSHTLSSYHLKTLLFWLAEEKGINYWSVHSLTECVMLSLETFLCWIEDGCIPQYIIRNNNLFDNEAGTSRQADLITILRVLISEGSECIMRNKFFQQLYRVMCLKPPNVENIIVLRERSCVHLYFAGVLKAVLDEILIGICTNQKSVMNICNAIRKLRSINDQYDYDVSMSIGYIENVLKSLCGTTLLSFLRESRLNNTSYLFWLKISEQLLTTPMHNSVVQLKLANFYYQIDQYKKAAKILQILSETNKYRIIKLDSTNKYSNIPSSMTNLGAIKSPFDFFMTYISTSLVFLSSEAHGLVDALKFEMFKPERQPSDINDKLSSLHIHNALVDPVVFTYFLQYLCYGCLKKRRYAEVALSNLRWHVKYGDVFHKETALNILGHCYSERGQLSRAAACFVKSFQTQSKFTVAPLHLAVLIGKAMKPR